VLEAAQPLVAVAAVGALLADQGRLQVAPEEAEFLVAVGVGSKSTTWWSTSFGGFAQPYEDYFDVWDRPGMLVRSHTYQDGTLVIDLVDAKSGELLWHGWVTEPIPIAGDDDDVIKKAVGKVLEQL